MSEIRSQADLELMRRTDLITRSLTRRRCEAAVRAHLTVRPATSAEIFQAMPEDEPLEIQDLLMWHRGCMQSDVQQVLVTLERAGVTTRLILPSVKAHLWWLL
ncbi:MAG TPA: hypothetical protein VGL39_27645 [Jatrophihabitantaceae bacterium]